MAERAELLAFMQANSFAALVTKDLAASHLPARVRDSGEQLVIDLHMAKNNRQWRAFDGSEVLVVFAGPHAYVSPRWYEDKERVPTWNYAAVHAYGVPRIMEERAHKHSSQRELVANLDPQWLPAFDALGAEYVDMMLNGIVNFEIPVSRIETRWKLSQNRGRREMELIAQALEKSGDSVERALAALTRKHLPPE
jgi:transcriptional regulator